MKKNYSMENMNKSLDLDVSSPLRNLNDIVNGFNILNNDKKMILTLFSVSHPNRNPYFNVVEKNESTGYYELVKKLKEPIQSRQNAPIVFDMNSSFYWYKRSFFDTNFKYYNKEYRDIFNRSYLF